MYVQQVGNGFLVVFPAENFYSHSGKTDPFAMLRSVAAKQGLQLLPVPSVFIDMESGSRAAIDATIECIRKSGVDIVALKKLYYDEKAKLDAQPKPAPVPMPFMNWGKLLS